MPEIWPGSKFPPNGYLKAGQARVLHSPLRDGPVDGVDGWFLPFTTFLFHQRMAAAYL